MDESGHLFTWAWFNELLYRKLLIRPEIVLGEFFPFAGSNLFGKVAQMCTIVV